MLKLTPPRGEELARFSESLSEASGDPQALALSVSNLLSAVTSLAGIVTVPRRAQTALRQIEFLPLSGHRVLAILVVNDREVQNKILNVSRDFGADELKKMKPTAILINTARGGLVDEAALAEALKAGTIAGAGFDVLSVEPPKDGNPLLELELPNFILTPHVAWSGRQAMQALADQLMDNVEDFVRGAPRNVVG